MIKLVNVGKKIWDGHYLKTVLEGVTIEIENGSFISIVGESGCGKTTLLSIIGLIDSVSCGQILFDEVNIAEKTEREMADFRGLNIGYLPQNNYLIPFMNVWDNVASVLALYGYTRKEANCITEMVLEKVGIEKNIFYHMPNKLSGGEKQRVAIARMLALKPKYVLADEPTGNLDKNNAVKIFEKFREINADGTTIIVVTHDMELAKKTDKIYKLEQRKLSVFDN